MSKLEEYRRAEQPVPEKMLRWHLYGAGLDNLGRDGRPEEVAVPDFGSDELLVRQDACGLCFSDTKVIGLGDNHPRLTGRDMKANPVTLGHEVAVTVVGVGESVKGRFKVGDRFVIQADVFYQGKSMAYGYVISGGLAEYSVIPKAVLDGDEGCYLLPIKDDTGYVESALTEPWACVVSAYAQSHRDGIKPGGKMLVVAGEGAGGLDRPYLFDAQPGQQVLVNVNDVSDWPALRQEKTAGEGFDDVILIGRFTPEAAEGAAACLADHGIMNFVGSSFERKLSLDIGRIHYNWHHYLGTDTVQPVNAYKETRTAELLPSGLCWIIGAGGPMGQMHVQRAVMLKNPPRRVVCTDVDAARLQSVADRLGAAAKERGVELVTLNPNEMTPDAYDAELRRLGDGRGYDDIVSMVPVAALVEHGQDFLADEGWFNIFAGVARGTMAKIDVNAIVKRRVRFLGSSGSSLSDMRETLARVEADELSTNASLAAVGGMEAAREGLQAVKEGWFPGKTLIFPHVHGLPLTPLPELRERMPSVYAKLENGQFWTQEAEEELLRLTVAKD